MSIREAPFSNEDHRVDTGRPAFLSCEKTVRLGGTVRASAHSRRQALLAVLAINPDGIRRTFSNHSSSLLIGHGGEELDEGGAAAHRVACTSRLEALGVQVRDLQSSAG